MSNMTISAAAFKARCLALLDEVARTGRPLTITKRGKPVARLCPPRTMKPRGLGGSVVAQGDLVSPIDADWAAEK